MKNGKRPTLAQKKLLKLNGLVPENWLIVKDTSESMEIVSRTELKKVFSRKRTRTISKKLE